MLVADGPTLRDVSEVMVTSALLAVVKEAGLTEMGEGSEPRDLNEVEQALLAKLKTANVTVKDKKIMEKAFNNPETLNTVMQHSKTAVEMQQAEVMLHRMHVQNRRKRTKRCTTKIDKCIVTHIVVYRSDHYPLIQCRCFV